MKKMVDIKVVIDEKFADPMVTIQTRKRTQQVEKIIEAIENVSEREYPFIPVYNEDTTELLS